MPKLDSNNFHSIKYADDTVLIELLKQMTDSLLNTSTATLSDWCSLNNLTLNVTKTKELIFSNKRHNPICDKLTVNGKPVERVTHFKYLGTILDEKLNFEANTEHIISKTRRRLYMTKRLHSLNIAEPIRRLCYKTFIESILLFHLSTIYGHLNSSSIASINKLIKLAGRLGNSEFEDIATLYKKTFRARSLRTIESESSIFQIERMPSGRCRTLKCRTTLRNNSFKNCYIKFKI